MTASKTEFRRRLDKALASETLDAARVNQVVEMVARLEQLPDVRGLTALLTAPS